MKYTTTAGALFLLAIGAACVPQSGEVMSPAEPGGSGGQVAPSTGGATGGASGAASGGSVGSPATASGGSTGSGAGGSPTASGGTSGGGEGSAAGSGGAGPSSTPADAAPATDTAAPSSPPATSPASGPDPESNFTCTLLIGINATAEWYGAGFEQIVDNAKWQMVRVHSGFVDLWAQPNSNFWNTNPTSPCAMNAKNPDRIIFIGLRFEWTSKQMWVDALNGVVKNIKAKYPGIKRVELGTFVRGPGNKPCGSRPAYRSTIHPSQDEAIAEVVATDPVLLRASPKFEATACSDFTGNPPHFGGAGAKNVAKLVGEYYAGKKE
jgi:hypothetical protein